eukprot:TRINITY_DN5439_c0_g11_i1.p1 TRINITY_DN5439_c0_g11~~TRINITY_DN5439_c0_g11_i1.p1  ORF type:complete len:568 (+),score=62.94 TRINITY_DN5439_c0_g11_i1:60-1706(+)
MTATGRSIGVAVEPSDVANALKPSSPGTPPSFENNKQKTNDKNRVLYGPLKPEDDIPGARIRGSESSAGRSSYHHITSQFTKLDPSIQFHHIRAEASRQMASDRVQEGRRVEEDRMTMMTQVFGSRGKFADGLQAGLDQARNLIVNQWPPVLREYWHALGASEIGYAGEMARRYRKEGGALIVVDRIAAPPVHFVGVAPYCRDSLQFFASYVRTVKPQVVGIGLTPPWTPMHKPADQIDSWATYPVETGWVQWAKTPSFLTWRKKPHVAWMREHFHRTMSCVEAAVGTLRAMQSAAYNWNLLLHVASFRACAGLASVPALAAHDVCVQSAEDVGAYVHRMSPPTWVVGRRWRWLASYLRPYSMVCGALSPKTANFPCVWEQSIDDGADDAEQCVVRAAFRAHLHANANPSTIPFASVDAVGGTGSSRPVVVAVDLNRMPSIQHVLKASDFTFPDHGLRTERGSILTRKRVQAASQYERSMDTGFLVAGCTMTLLFRSVLMRSQRLMFRRALDASIAASMMWMVSTAYTVYVSEAVPERYMRRQLSVPE